MYKTKDFNKIYLNLYCEDHIHLSVSSINQFYSNLTLFKQNKLLNQSTYIFDIPQNLVLSLLSMERFQQEISKQFFHYFKQSKHFKNLALQRIKDIKIFLFRFSFTNELEIDLFNTEIFGQLTYQQKQLAKQTFIQKNSDVNGFTYFNKNLDQNIFIIVLNNDSNNQYETLYHQLSHTIQQMLEIKISNSIDIFTKNFNEQYLKQFDIDFNTFKNYLSPIQFLPTIQDLIQGLNKVYNTYYTNLNMRDFLYYVFAQLKQKNPRNIQLTKQYITMNNDLNPLIILFCSFHYNYKFQKIKHLLIKHF